MSNVTTQSVRRRVEKRRISLTTNASGTTTETSKIQGEIVKLYYDPGTFTGTVNLDITDNDTSEKVWNENAVGTASKTVYPLVALHGTGGSVLASQYDRANTDTISIAVTEAGNAKTGYVTIFYR